MFENISSFKVQGKQRKKGDMWIYLIDRRPENEFIHDFSMTWWQTIFLSDCGHLSLKWMTIAFIAHFYEWDSCGFEFCHMTTTCIDAIIFHSKIFIFKRPQKIKSILWLDLWLKVLKQLKTNAKSIGKGIMLAWYMASHVTSHHWAPTDHWSLTTMWWGIMNTEREREVVIGDKSHRWGEVTTWDHQGLRCQ